jgi:hypothetical protein
MFGSFYSELLVFSIMFGLIQENISVAFTLFLLSNLLVVPEVKKTIAVVSL